MKKRYKKLILFLSLCFSMFIGLTVSSHAYYINNEGNYVSENLFNINDVSSNSSPYSIQNNSLLIVNNNTSNVWANVNYIVDIESSSTYTFSCAQTERTFVYIFEFLSDSTYNIIRGDGQTTSLNVVETFTTSSNASYIQFSFYDSNRVGNTISNIMFNVGSSALPWEPYGTWYSQINYENYGASQYSQGYTDGFNSIYNSLIDVNLSEHVTGVGCGIYNSTGTTFVQNGTITSVYFENNYYHLEVAPIIDGNYYVIPITFDNNYIFSSFRWTPNRLSSPSLTINGVIYDSSTVGYNGSTYGWDNLNVNLDTATNYIEFKFKIYSNFEFINLYINGKNLEIATALESYQTGYDNGQTVGYQDGYSAGFTAGSQSVTTDNTNFQKLIWTIGSTPFESFKTIWNVDVMGLNISGIILGGLMALLVLYLIKKIWK